MDDSSEPVGNDLTENSAPAAVRGGVFTGKLAPEIAAQRKITRANQWLLAFPAILPTIGIISFA
jgi:hypothetical protein